MLLIHFVLACFTLLIIWVFPSLQEKYSAEQSQQVFTFSVSFASFVLIFIALLIGPLHVIIKNSLPLLFWSRVRSICGIWASLLLTVHLFLLWKDFYHFSFDQATKGGVWYGWLEFLILHSAFAYVILMGLTSNNWSKRLLAAKWKKLHRGIYILFPAIALAGAYEMERIQAHEALIALALFSGGLIPALQIWGRSRLTLQKRQFANGL